MRRPGPIDAKPKQKLARAAGPALKLPARPRPPIICPNDESNGPMLVSRIAMTPVTSPTMGQPFTRLASRTDMLAPARRPVAADITPTAARRGTRDGLSGRSA